MKRAYILVYSDSMGSREQVKQFLDERSEISHWRYDLPNAFYIVSELSADNLYKIIQELNQERGRFLVCEVGSNKQGWLPKKTWALLNDKKYLK